MSTPKSVKNAVLVVWGTLAVSAISALIAKVAGLTTEGEFIGNLFVYALFCIIPYKLGNRSNAARYVYAVLFVLTLAVMLGSSVHINKIDFVVSILMIPAEIYVLMMLFGREASEWFSAK
ncbi:hypothetical protein Q9Q94_10375 [Uliginosibacterium sp. 31-16]|uniref:hypothetical protein n=1 Tax=Uliginosibacterium sp. 31-16 TaxID=3068315 RepID=UPI00273D578E|nr:hypothetical protein [Uliginosibacterium sp. 31-16]MDP5239941.1 hypothetical protein [Uliginosibacterium sp. 31-16]